MRNAPRWVGRALSGIAVAFMLVDGGMKVAHAGPSVEAMAALGYPAGTLDVIGWLALCATVLYAVPPTARIGAVMLTGFLGGAVAANLRVGAPLMTHVLFPVYLGSMSWIGLVLRGHVDARPLGRLIPTPRDIPAAGYPEAR